MSENNGVGIQSWYALDVLDEDEYQKYREAMTPILQQHGGRFVVDVKVATVLKLPKPGPVNRLFSIEFPSQERLAAFFANPDYLAARQRHFESSVGNIAVLGQMQPLLDNPVHRT